MTRRTTLFLSLTLAISACAPMRLVRFKDPLTTQEHLVLGTSYQNQDLTAQAEHEYRAAIRRDKNNVAARVALGNLLFAHNRFADAEKVFSKAHRIAPSNLAISNNLAMVYLARGKKLKTAEKLAKKASEDPRLRPYALDTLAMAYVGLKQWDKARAVLDEQEAVLLPKDPEFTAQHEKTRLLVSERNAE